LDAAASCAGEQDIELGTPIIGFRLSSQLPIASGGENLNDAALMDPRIIDFPAPFWIAVLLAIGPLTAAGDEIFDVSEVNARGRVVSAQFGDFDGDGLKDLMVATLDGVPPAESRTMRVHLQTPDGTYPETPSHRVPIPRWSAVYDVADIRDTPGDELVLLRPDGITIISLADAAGQQWHLPVEGPSTIAAAEDERGFDQFRLVYDEPGNGIGDEPWILAPQIGQVSALTADGTLMAQIDVGRRANYYVAKDQGFVSVESDIQLFLDVPKLSIGDVDGDGRADIVAATRHEIRVFLRETAGGFLRQPSYTHPLTFISQRDHSRGSGSVVTNARDIDGDGRLDLAITHTDGTFSDTVTTTYVYRNRTGGWDLANPDDRFVTEGALSSDLLMDIDGDGPVELLRIQIKLSVLEIVELLLTREIDAIIAIHRLQPDGRYDTKPWSRKKVGTGIDFETFRPKGFMPRAGLDINADGLMDFVTSADGKGIEVYLGGDDGPFARRSAMQKMPTTGVIRFADFNGDNYPDFVLYDTQSFDSPVRIGRNLGTLPRASALDD
jgi:hypothetical protein